MSYYLRRSIITISCIANEKFNILTPDDLETQLGNDWIGPSYDIKNLIFNEILSHLEGNSIFYTSSNPYVSNTLNLQPIRNIFETFPSLR